MRSQSCPSWSKSGLLWVRAALPSILFPLLVQGIKASRKRPARRKVNSFCGEACIWWHGLSLLWEGVTWWHLAWSIPLMERAWAPLCSCYCAVRAACCSHSVLDKRAAPRRQPCFRCCSFEKCPKARLVFLVPHPKSSLAPGEGIRSSWSKRRACVQRIARCWGTNPWWGFLQEYMHCKSHQPQGFVFLVSSPPWRIKVNW